MPSRVNGISNLRIKLAFVPRPSAKVRLVHRKPSLSASATLSTICSAVEKRRGAPRPHRSDLRSGANADKVLGVYFSRPGHCALRPIPPPDQIQAGSWLVRELPIKRRRTEVFV